MPVNRLRRALPGLIGCFTIAIIAPGSSQSVAPVLFAPGEVSTALPEFSLTLTADGRSAWFVRATADRSRSAIMTSSFDGTQWSEAIAAAFSGRWLDVDPFLTPDGRRLYFSSTRPRRDSTAKEMNTWFVERTPSGWSEPVDAGDPLNSDSNDVFVSGTRAGELVFASNREGPSRLFIGTPVGSGFRVTRLDPTLPDGLGNPMISPSGRLLVAFQVVEGRGPDLVYSCRVAAGWTPVRPLAASVNSASADFAPYLDAAEETLYFTSERPRAGVTTPAGARPPGDLYRVALRNTGIECPTGAGTPR